MSISKEDVKYVAGLARLEFTEEELTQLQEDLSAVLDYAKALEEVSTEDIKPTEHILNVQNVFRKDKVKDSLPLEEVFKNAPDQEAGGFKVPKVIE